MKELLIEGGRSMWIGRGGGSSVVAIYLGDVPGENEALETIDI